MPVSAETLALLMESGVTGDALVEVVRSIDADSGMMKPARSARQERNRRYYLKRKTTESVLNQASDKTTEPPQENNQPPRSSLRSVRDQARAAFADEFWPDYPKRSGSNPRQPAEAKFVRICETGVDPADIVAGVRRYAASVAEGDPKFVKQAITWLNQHCWTDDFTPAAPARANGARAGPLFERPEPRHPAFAARDEILAEIAEERRRNGH